MQVASAGAINNSADAFALKPSSHSSQSGGADLHNLVKLQSSSQRRPSLQELLSQLSQPRSGQVQQKPQAAPSQHV